MTRPGDGWDKVAEEMLEEARREEELGKCRKVLNGGAFPDSEWPKGRAFGSQPVPPPSRLIPENYRRGDKVAEPIQGQYYDAFKGETLLEMKEYDRNRMEEYIKNMFTGKTRRPIIVADNQPRLSSDGSTLVSDAYHWLPIANAPLNTKLQLINRADGVANYGTITNANRHLFTHYAELPTFKD